MSFENIAINSPLAELLEAVYAKLKKIEPDLTEAAFIERIFNYWAEPYQRDRELHPVPRAAAVLKNNLDIAFQLSHKTRAQVAREVGISRSYLNELVNGKYEPSIKVAFLLAEALGYPPERLKELFYLELAEE